MKSLGRFLMICHKSSLSKAIRFSLSEMSFLSHFPSSLHRVFCFSLLTIWYRHHSHWYLLPTTCITDPQCCCQFQLCILPRCAYKNAGSPVLEPLWGQPTPIRQWPSLLVHPMVGESLSSHLTWQHLLVLDYTHSTDPQRHCRVGFCSSTKRA